VALLSYSYATGVFTSCKLEQATHDSVALCFITGDEHSDHHTIATFRKHFLADQEDLFVQMLVLAKAWAYTSRARSVWTEPGSKPVPARAGGDGSRHTQGEKMRVKL